MRQESSSRRGAAWAAAGHAVGRWLREPVVHFLLGGAALFALYGLVAEEEAAAPARIVVDEARVESLAAGFERTWMRPPTQAELAGLVDDYVIEEILYREAVALGLDRDDLIVRRRMRQKMEFLHEDLAERAPSDAELQAFLEAAPETFRVPGRVGFEQVFLGEAGDRAEARAAQARARLRGGEAPAAVGEPTLLPARLADATRGEVARTFGGAFAEALAEAPADAWIGPVPSAFGVHVVRVTDRTPPRLPALHEVRGQVAREWAAAQRAEARERFHRALRERYEVVLPSAPPSATLGAVAP